MYNRNCHSTLLVSKLILSITFPPQFIYLTNREDKLKDI